MAPICFVEILFLGPKTLDFSNRKKEVGVFPVNQIGFNHLQSMLHVGSILETDVEQIIY
jgi:hypothetical protein